MNKLLDLRIDYKTNSEWTDWRTGPIYHLDGLTCPAQMFMRVFHGVIKNNRDRTHECNLLRCVASVKRMSIQI